MRKTIKRAAALIVILFILISLASCAEERAAPETTAEPEPVFTPIETDPATDASPSDTFTDEIPPPETAAPTEDGTTDTDGTTTEELVWTPITEVEEDLVFGTEDPETSSSPATAYEPYYPSAGGRAPLALMYHLVLDEPYSDLVNLFVRPSELRGHIEALLEKGYTFIFADEYACSDEKTVIMSFDDGYLDNYTEVFPIIKQYNVKITIFMITNYINGTDYLSDWMIREMASSGLVSFQSHTASHPNLCYLSQDAMRNEFETSNAVLEGLTGRKVKALCYPTGAYDYNVTSVAGEYYSFAYTTVSTTTTARVAR